MAARGWRAMRQRGRWQARMQRGAIILDVRPTDGRPGFYDASISVGDGRPMRPSRYPLLDACRALIAAGADPRSEIELWHAGATHYSLRAVIGDAARLMVRETRGRPIFVKHQPFGLRPVPRSR
jgi:hypothetical protein